MKLHNFMANAIKQIVKIVSIWLTCTHSQKVSTYIRRQQQHLYASFFTFDLTRHSWDCYWFGLTAFGGHGKIQFDGNFEWGYLKNGMYVHWLKSAFETFLSGLRLKTCKNQYIKVLGRWRFEIKEKKILTWQRFYWLKVLFFRAFMSGKVPKYQLNY